MQKELLRRLALELYQVRKDQDPWDQVEETYCRETEAVVRKLCQELLPSMMRYSSIVMQLPKTSPEVETSQNYLRALIIVLQNTLCDEELCDYTV